MTLKAFVSSAQISGGDVYHNAAVFENGILMMIGSVPLVIAGQAIILATDTPTTLRTKVVLAFQASFNTATGRVDGNTLTFEWLGAETLGLLQGTVLNTGSDGRITWTFTSPFAVTPVIAATPVDLAAGDNSSFNVDVESVSATSCTVRVWRTQSILGLGVFPTSPAPAGTPCHLMACLPN